MELVKNNSMYIVPPLLYSLLYLLDYLFIYLWFFWFVRISLFVPYNWIHSVICWYFYFLMDWDIIQAQCKPIIILTSSLATIDNTTRILNFDICWNNYRCNSRKCCAQSRSLLRLTEINRVEESTLKEDSYSFIICQIYVERTRAFSVYLFCPNFTSLTSYNWFLSDQKKIDITSLWSVKPEYEKQKNTETSQNCVICFLVLCVKQ